MSARTEARKAETIDSLAQLAASRLDADAGAQSQAADFLRRFYANVAPEDIAERGLDDLYGAGLALWQFGRQRAAGTTKVRVYNPRLAEHGWASTHTVVEIVNDDMPFLVDSITAELNRRDISVHLVIHPVLRVARDQAGALGGLAEDGQRESWMHIEIDAQGDDPACAAVQTALAAVLADVRVCVDDWRAIQACCDQTVAELTQSPPPRPEGEVASTRDFLSWLATDNFTFLGYRESRYLGEGASFRHEVVPESGLGLLRSPDFVVFDVLRNVTVLPRLEQFVRAPELLRIAKANRRSTVHRSAYLDAIGIKQYDAEGRVVGEKLFLGLFTSTAYMQRPTDIPLLRDKVRAVIGLAGFPPGGHAAKNLQHVLETFPRDEMFQTPVDELYDTTIGITRLQERQRIALFLRRDPFDRFVSALVYVPRDRFSTDLRRRFHEILAQAYNGRTSAYYTQLADDSALVRIHLIVGTTPGEVPDVRPEDVERQLVEAGRSFGDRLKDALLASLGEAQGLPKLRRFQDAFPASYRERFSPEQAALDIGALDAVLSGARRLVLSLYRTVDSKENELRLRLFHRDAPVPLSDVMPMLENMGLKVLTEDPFRIRPRVDPLVPGKATVYLHDLQMSVRDAREIDLPRVKPLFEEAFAEIFAGDAASDGFNRLVLGAAMAMTEVRVLRAFAAFLRQAGIPFSQAYMEDTLTKYPHIARRLVDLFLTMHDPKLAGDRAAAEAAIVAELAKLFDGVTSLDEDRILRRFLNAIQSSLRTNHFQRDADGRPKSYLSFKLDSQRIDDLPLPRPLYEVFVFSPRVEAVHLRGGKVARGGIRWSDRREDFRTEILGLIKAQMVKNAVIVPVGSKGGFFVKRPPAPEAGRDAYMAEGIYCYQTLMRGLLDITDNLSPAGVVPPPDVVRRDDDDPYLVVAADKGTATFSDIANAVSREYGFWLDDAFASGGSAGYDHKAMGITARGAWEAVKRHFREIGTDIQKTDFTVVGVGDMSGDVFGNGMLLSRHIRLVAAFDHRNIFIDPEPDAAVSFAERERLFKLPRSSWADYDPSLISAGGGVFDRKAKSIRLSDEIRRRFGISEEQLTPTALMQVLLKAEVDLLWFGGIGNYIKASTESHAECGDRANDALRIDGRDVRAKVVGEGANLGVTQRGRIEYALAGGRINNDAVDNSAGVDTSDHEVNIKILLGDVCARGDMTVKQRDKLMAEMTDEVGGLVLRDNYLQTQALSIAELDGAGALDSYARMMKALERTGRLNRAIEFLPPDESLVERAAAGRGLTRPELAVLMAYAKMALYDELLESDLPDEPWLELDLERYFPEALRQRHKDAVLRHRLRREIIATVVTNSLVNRTGIGFVNDLKEASGLAAGDLARAYLAAREMFGLRDYWGAAEALDNQVPAATQYRMLRLTNALIDFTTAWLLRHVPAPIPVAETVRRFAGPVAALRTALPGLLDEGRRASFAARCAGLVADGVPEGLAGDFALLSDLIAAPDLVRIAEGAGQGIEDVSAVYFALGARLGFDWLHDAAARLPAASGWQARAVEAMIDDLYAQQAEVTARVLKVDGGQAAWAEQRRAVLARFDALLTELRALPSVDLAALTVAGRELRALVAL